MIPAQAPLTVILAALVLRSTDCALVTTSERVLLAEASRFRPLVAKTYDQLVYASFPREPDPKIRLESEKIGYRACEILLPAHLKLQQPLSLDSLASGKLVLGILAGDDRDLLVVVADPDSCEFDHAVVRLPGAYPKEPAIVVGEEVFDVFLTSHPNCSAGKACRLRYDQKAVLVGTTDFDPADGGYGGWAVSSVMEKDFAQGYFFTVFAGNRTIVRRLDEDLQVKAERHLGKSFLFSDHFRQLSSCRGISRHKLACRFLDEELRDRGELELDAQPYRRYLRSAQLVSLPRGGAVLYLLLQLDGRHEFVSYLQRIEPHGRVGRALAFQEDVCKDTGKLSLVVSRMHEDLVCLSLPCRYSVRTKCVAFDE